MIFLVPFLPSFYFFYSTSTRMWPKTWVGILRLDYGLKWLWLLLWVPPPFSLFLLPSPSSLAPPPLCSLWYKLLGWEAAWEGKPAEGSHTQAAQVRRSWNLLATIEVTWKRIFWRLLQGTWATWERVISGLKMFTAKPTVWLCLFKDLEQEPPS